MSLWSKLDFIFIEITRVLVGLSRRLKSVRSWVQFSTLTIFCDNKYSEIIEFQIGWIINLTKFVLCIFYLTTMNSYFYYFLVLANLLNLFHYYFCWLRIWFTFYSVWIQFICFSLPFVFECIFIFSSFESFQTKLFDIRPKASQVKAHSKNPLIKI